MHLTHHIYRAFHTVAVAAGMMPNLPQLPQFALRPAEIDALRAESTSGIKEAFFNHGHRPADKWVQYFEVYEQHFERYRDKEFFFLEIGVSHGGSLDMWRRYFGDKATIVGIDIDRRCASRVDKPNHVRIGSQDDPAFLNSVIAEFGRPDIVLDDGSHIARHQQASFDILFPHVKDGGIYAIEDTCTSYWPDWEGGYRRPGSAIELTKQVIDDMHEWHHNRPTKTPARDYISGTHVYDSVVVFDKVKRKRPAFLAA